MTTCQRCGKQPGLHGIAIPGGYEIVCEECLTPEEQGYERD